MTGGEIWRLSRVEWDALCEREPWKYGSLREEWEQTEACKHFWNAAMEQPTPDPTGKPPIDWSAITRDSAA